MKRAAIVTVLTAAALLGLVGSLAADVFSGCYVCAERRTWSPTAPTSYYCKHVGINEAGDGTTCYEESIAGGTACGTGGNACYNIVVTGGGGGTGTGGGGGGSCAYDNNGYCAPWCSACSQV